MEAQDWELFPSPWFDLPAEPPTFASRSLASPCPPQHEDNNTGDFSSWQGFGFNFSVDPGAMGREILDEHDFFDLDATGDGEEGREHEGPEVLAEPSSSAALPHTSQPITSSEPSTRPVRARATRKPKIRKENWAAHKERIRTLYIDHDKKLEEVMEIMREEHDFDASAPMYKEKFQEWGFLKYIPKAIVGKLIRIGDERKPKLTEYVQSGRIWTYEELKKKDGKRRREHEDHEPERSPVLPSGLVVRTPRMISPVLQNAITRETTPNMLPAMAGTIMRHSPGDVTSSPNIQFLLDTTPRRWGPSIPSPLGAFGRPWSSAVQEPISDSSRTRNPFFPPERRTSAQGFLPPFSRSHTPKAPEYPWRTPLPPITELLHSLVSGGDTNIAGLQIMRQQADYLLSQGKIDEGIAKLRVILSRFQELLSPTHNFTMDVAYDLARLLGIHNDMAEANEILDWLSSSLVKKHGIHNQKTIAHYIKVVTLLRVWSRDEDAELLIYKIADAWEDQSEIAAPAIPGALPALSTLVSFPDDDIKRLFYDPDCEQTVEVQLRLVELLLSSKKLPELATHLELVSQKLVTYCEQENLLAQTIRATICLSKLHRATATREQALGVVDKLVPKLEDFWSSGYEPSSQSFLKSSMELAFFYHSIDLSPQCCDVLELTASGLESRPVRLEKEKKDLINFCICVDMEWQKRKSSPDVELWVERALAKSMQLFGANHPKTKALEKAWESGTCLWTAADLLTFEIDETVNWSLRV